jgi:glycosyltransferase involved in cell wall biosynthesis
MHTTRVLHVTNADFTLKQYFQGQLAYMSGHGYDIHVATAPGPLISDFKEEMSGDIHTFPIRRTISPVADVRAIKDLCGLIRHIRPDLVHAHTPKGGLVGMTAASLCGVRGKIFHLRGLPYLTASGVRRRILLESDRFTVATARRVLCVSKSIRSEALKSGIGCENKLIAYGNGSGNGVDVAHFDVREHADAAAELRRVHDVPPEVPVVGFVGRLGREKGLIELSRAWSHLRKRNDRPYLFVVGPIDERDPAPKVVLDALRTDPQVRVFGYVRDPAAHYAAMSLLAFPSRREGFGIVAVEAAAMGLPVIGCRIPGVVDAIEDGVTGTLIPTGDHRQLSSAIERYLDDPSIRCAHGAAGRFRARKLFSQESVWEAIRREYETVLARDADGKPTWGSTSR